MAYFGSSLYYVADNLGVTALSQVAKQVGVISVLRITAFYPERRARHTVSTVIERHQNQRRLEIVYEGFYDHQPIILAVSEDNFTALNQVLRQVKFDKLDDQTGISYKDHSLWLIQRAATTYSHGVIVSPDVPKLPYSTLVNAIDAYLPESIREVPFD